MIVRALALFLMVLAAPVQSGAQTNLCTAVANGATVDITGPNGICKRVTNASGQIACAMTGSTASWTEFYAKGMPGVTIADCPAVCGGYNYGGYCYYASNGTSCDTACASRGGCNLAGTRAASTSSACTSLSTALGYTVYWSSPTSPAPAGCHVYVVVDCSDPYSNCSVWTDAYYAPDPSTVTCGANPGAGAAARVCACNS